MEAALATHGYETGLRYQAGLSPRQNTADQAEPVSGREPN